MILIPSKAVLLLLLNLLFLGSIQGTATKGREYSSYLPPEEPRPEYQIFQYPPNYPFKEDYSECAKNPMIPLLGKGLNILLLKLGAVGMMKAVLALMFLGMLLKLPLLLLKMAFMKSFFLPLLVAPFLFNMFLNHMTQSSDSKPDSSEVPEMPEMPGMSEMTAGMPGMSGMPAGMPGMSGMPAGMPGMNGMAAGMTGMNGMAAGMTGMNGMAAGMPGMNGMAAGMPGMNGMAAGMPGMNGMAAGMNGMPAEKPMMRAMTDAFMVMGRQINDNLTSIAWESLKMFADSDQCAERISCMIGASTKDSYLENLLMRVLKYLYHSSPPILRKRVSQIREAFQKGSRSLTCLQEDYECHSPELLLQYGIKKVKIL